MQEGFNIYSRARTRKAYKKKTSVQTRLHSKMDMYYIYYKREWFGLVHNIPLDLKTINNMNNIT